MKVWMLTGALVVVSALIIAGGIKAVEKEKKTIRKKK
jgi:hypothetical protein